MFQFSPDERREALGHVLVSREFLRSKQLRELLSYLVEAAIQDRTDVLKKSVCKDAELLRLPITHIGSRSEGAAERPCGSSLVTAAAQFEERAALRGDIDVLRGDE